MNALLSLAQQAKGSANAWHLAQDSNSGHTLVAERGGREETEKACGEKRMQGDAEGAVFVRKF